MAGLATSCAAEQKVKFNLDRLNREATHRRLDRAVECHNGRGRSKCSWASERTRSHLQPLRIDSHLDTAALAQLCRS
jgi:hypothetical protein